MFGVNRDDDVVSGAFVTLFLFHIPRFAYPALTPQKSFTVALHLRARARFIIIIGRTVECPLNWIGLNCQARELPAYA